MPHYKVTLNNGDKTRDVTIQDDRDFERLAAMLASAGYLSTVKVQVEPSEGSGPRFSGEQPIALYASNVVSIVEAKFDSKSGRPTS